MKNISFASEQQALADLLRDLRVSVGITQEQLAESLRWRQTDVSKVERCIRQLGHVELRHWIRALGIDMFGLEIEFQARLQSLGIAEPFPPGGLRSKRQKLE
ncbi:MAG: helix-turn-helix domain-containing protein [Proteobacteria bacterium]|nr:helix-turn-helix domain-containing protein [Pseudomonadota bacterium]